MSRPSSSIPREEVILATHLEPSFADIEKARWKKLSASKTFSTSAPPYLTPTIDPKLLEAANIHCTNKASMLRMQHRSQNVIRPNADIKKTVNQNKLFDRKSKILTASIVLSNGPDMSHEFLMGSRYNSIRAIDTNPLMVGGVCVSRSSKSRSFFNPTQPHKARRAYSAPHPRIPPTTHAPRSQVIVQEPVNREPLCIQGVKYGKEEQKSHSSAPILKTADRNHSGIRYETEETKKYVSTAFEMLTPPLIDYEYTVDTSNYFCKDADYASEIDGDSSNTDDLVSNVGGNHTPSNRDHTPSAESRVSSCDTAISPHVNRPHSSLPYHIIEENDYNNDDNFYEENENDLLSPEAQKLTSEILMGISQTSLGSRTISQVSVSSTASQEMPEDIGTCPGVLFTEVGSSPGHSDILADDNCVEDTASSSHTLVVDMSHLTSASDLNDT